MKKVDVNPKRVTSFNVDKFVAEYQKEYDNPSPRHPDMPEEERARPSELKERILAKLKDIYETTACYDCPFKLVCRNRVWNYGCEFAKVTGCSDHPDQGRYPGHSVTVQITDTSKSCQRSRQDTTWSNTRTTSSGNGSSSSDMSPQAAPASNYWIARPMWIFDTSGIPTGSTVEDAHFYLYSTAKSGSFTMRIQDGQPTYPSDPIVDGDYDYSNWSGSYGDKLASAITTSAWNEISFSSYTVITVGGSSKHIIREKDHDIDDSTPGANYYVTFEGPTHAGGHDPQLHITYASLARDAGPLWNTPLG